MWQTLLNSATFGHNAAVGQAVKAKKPWQRRIDWLVVVALAIPAFAVAVPLEIGGAVFRRGSAISMKFDLL